MEYHPPCFLRKKERGSSLVHLLSSVLRPLSSVLCPLSSVLYLLPLPPAETENSRLLLDAYFAWNRPVPSSCRTSACLQQTEAKNQMPEIRRQMFLSSVLWPLSSAAMSFSISSLLLPSPPAADKIKTRKISSESCASLSICRIF